MISPLPRIPRPHGAIAVVNQESFRRPTPPPRGMTLNPTFTINRTLEVPKDSAASHLGILLRGYLSTCCVLPAESALEATLMLAAENRELLHACTGVQALDDSLPPRPVAVTLLAHGTQEVHCNGARVYLDALAHFAASDLTVTEGAQVPGAHAIRMSVLAGEDARWFAETTRQQALDPNPPWEAGAVDLCVRWAVPGNIGVRSEVCRLPLGKTPDQSLDVIQNLLLTLAVHDGAPFPAAVAAGKDAVPNDAWARALHASSARFFALMEDKACVHKGAIFKAHEHEVTMENSNIFVRICPRVILDPGIQAWVPLPVDKAVKHADAFHAFLVGNAAWVKEVGEHCKLHESTGLPMPDEDTAAFCLHTCAVQANRFHLGRRVSLYATHHKHGGQTPGVPIVAPGSWIWRMEPAVVALEDVLRNFHVVPCSRESIMPGDRKLERPFYSFFNRAMRLYADTFGGARPSRGDDFERLPVSLPPCKADDDPAMRAAEDYALTSFGLDASSRRICVGEAYATLNDRAGAPPELVKLMLNASLRYGVNTSIVKAMGQAADTVKQDGAVEVQLQDVERYKRLADAALMVNLKRPRVASKPVSISSLHVKKMMQTIGLRKGMETFLPRDHGDPGDGGGDYSEVVRTLASCVLNTSLDLNVLHDACLAAKQARTCSAMAALAAIIMVLRASPDPMLGTVFLIGQTDKANTLSFDRVDHGGHFTATTPGTIMDCVVKAVLFTKITGESVRLTATVPK